MSYFVEFICLIRGTLVRYVSMGAKPGRSATHFSRSVISKVLGNERDVCASWNNFGRNYYFTTSSSIPFGKYFTFFSVHFYYGGKVQRPFCMWENFGMCFGWSACALRFQSDSIEYGDRLPLVIGMVTVFQTKKAKQHERKRQAFLVKLDVAFCL